MVTAFRSFIVIAAALGCVQAQSVNKTGRVVDEKGAAVAAAAVTFTSANNGGAPMHATTGQDGTFEIPPAFDGSLVVEANGFLRYEVKWNASSDIEIALARPPVTAAVTVTGQETRLGDTPSSVVALNDSTLEQTAASTLDDKLRQVPGFSLFRRAGSRTANPTTAGVSLRGIGASGASRALVLIDGIPLNDPFGGWIYWGRVPAESVSAVEILRGSSSDLYGNSAIGGIVSVVSKPATLDPQADIEVSYGSQNTPSVSAFATAGRHKFFGSLAAEFFKTSGFVPVAEAERGPVDTRADVDRWAIDPAIEWRRNENFRLFAAAGFYSEVRRNGTPLQNNDTRLRSYSAGADINSERFGRLSLRGYGGPQLYHQSFTAIAGDRSTESLTRLQTAPARVVGFSARWSANFRTKNLFTAGFETRRVRGRSDETPISGGNATSQVSSGGTELTFGTYAGLMIPVGSRLTLSGGVRFDRWRERAGFSNTRSLISGQTTFQNFPGRSESAVSPRASILYKLSEGLSLSASFSTGFRQPTLNELYRSFRVGNALTLANADLRAESAKNFEAGAISSNL
ncbi:MAG TPA: TonB-dependent receptor, partial [Pyrinomonadaceae bacterium]|nr:TonB-dependent receptor [Pyrinomonadaceae bacterium]